MESIHKRGVSKEHPKGHLIQLAVGFTFFLIWILDSFIFMFSTILANYISFFIRLILFLSFLIIGFFLVFRTGHLLFHKEDTSSKLIKTGIFAHTRHPLYLGVLIVYIGFILLTISMLSIVGFIIAGIIVSIGFAAIKESSYMLIDACDGECVDKSYMIKKIAEQIEGVESAHIVRLRRSGPVLQGELEIQVTCDMKIREFNKIKDKINKKIIEEFDDIEKFTITAVTVEKKT